MGRLFLLSGLLGLLPALAAGDGIHSGSAPLDCSVLPPGFAADASVCLLQQTPQASTNSTASSKDPSSTKSQWTRSGVCRQLDGTDYCAFTKSTFNGGEGISLITTPERLEKIASRFASDEAIYGSPSHVSFTGSRPYVDVELPGKGIGLVATRPIRAGHRILTRNPAVMVDGRALGGLPRNDLADLLVPAIELLPQHHQAQFLNLSTHDGADNYTDKIYKIYTTNAFKTSIDRDPAFHSTFVEMSRINHECRPNCGYYFDPVAMAQRVYAVRDIMPGEELTVAYIDPIQARPARQNRLHQDWGFQCSCQRCTAEEHLGAESDERVEEIKKLWKELDDYSKASKATPGKAELLITLFQLEGLEGRVHEAYYRVALEYSGVGDAGMAMKYARLCLDRGLLLRGPNQPFLTSMRELIKEPEKHWSWRFRLQDKQSK